MLPSPDILNAYEHGKYVLSNLAAKRAKQLREGAIPLVQVESNHPLTIALAEIAAGKIKAIMPTYSEVAAPTDVINILTDETVPSELGLLLPALDETEVVLVGVPGLEEDHEAEEHEDAEIASISDLIGEEDETAVVPAEEDTLSLSDIAEQETSLEDAEGEDSV
ncbi:MAG: DNA-directed RNA polymerase subunit omega [Armatimonadetes bacterium]|nr:DNA-directed RNA polymerase subunit omega [Armatimonadota bacterium]